MEWVILEKFSNQYVSKYHEYLPEKWLTSNKDYAKVFKDEESAVNHAVYLKKTYNAPYRTYLVLFGNAKWDESWPVPKEVYLVPLTINEIENNFI